MMGSARWCARGLAEEDGDDSLGLVCSVIDTAEHSGVVVAMEQGKWVSDSATGLGRRLEGEHGERMIGRWGLGGRGHGRERRLCVYSNGRG